MDGDGYNYLYFSSSWFFHPFCPWRNGVGGLRFTDIMKIIFCGFNQVHCNMTAHSTRKTFIH